jgi:molybdenum cofactor cytidylyltransferase
VLPAIVLAAGKSTRMGRLKANLPLGDGQTFLTRIVGTLLEAGIDDVVIVVGHEAESVIAAFASSGLPARFVVNQDYESGQLSSLLAGLTLVDRPGVAAALITLVVVPLSTAGTVRTVLDQYRGTHAPVVRPTRGSEHGHPLLIDRSLFDALRRADPVAGGKSVVRSHATSVGDVPIDDEGAFFDVDTPDDYQRALAYVRDRT